MVDSVFVIDLTREFVEHFFQRGAAGEHLLHAGGREFDHAIGKRNLPKFRCGKPFSTPPPCAGVTIMIS